MMTASTETLCPACGAANQCAIASGTAAEACWCMRVETKLSVPATGNSCYCANCLRRIANAGNKTHARTE